MASRRLKPGITIEPADQDLVRAHQPIFDSRDKEKVVTPFARDLRAELTRDYGTIASTLGAAVSLLLIVACANVAARDAGARACPPPRNRHSPGRWRQPHRLLRQLLVENIILSVVGGALGLLDRAMGDPAADRRPARSGARLDRVHARRAAW